MRRKCGVGHRVGSGPALLRRSGLVLGLALVVVLGCLGGTASAAVTGLRVVSGTSDVATSFNKGVTVGCFGGEQVLGAGGDITGGAGQVVIDDITPNAALSQVTVSGAEDDNGFAGNWTVTAFAVCANPVPGLQRVAATSASTSSNKGVTASCPAGKRVLGAGGDITGGEGQVVLDDVAPNSLLTSVTVQGFEDETGVAGDWSLRAHAICATPPPGLQLVSATTEPDSDPQSVPASCPSGKNLLGTGAQIAGGIGQVVLDDIRPNATLTSVFVTGLEDENGFTGNWTVTAFAICANP